MAKLLDMQRKFLVTEAMSIPKLKRKDLCELCGKPAINLLRQEYFNVNHINSPFLAQALTSSLSL